MMNKQLFLKIAKVKDEQSFYDLYPTQEAFMKVHGKAFKKAQSGADMNKNGVPDYLEYNQNAPQQIQAFGPQNQQNNVPQIQAGQQSTGNSINAPMDLSSSFKKQQNYAANSQKAAKDNKGFKTGIKMIDSVIGGFRALKAEKDAKKQAEQWERVSEVALKASQSTDVNFRNDISDSAERARKAMMPEMTGESLFPVNGVGTNVLTKNGGKMKSKGELQNTYAPKDIYTDLGYEPLSDEDIVKQYKMGGFVPKAQSGWGSMLSSVMGKASSSGATSAASSSAAGSAGSAGAAAGKSGGGKGSNMNWAAMGDVGGTMASSATGNNAGGQIGGTVGEGIGSIFGPIGGAIGKTAGTAIGGFLDKNPKRIKRAQTAMLSNIGNMAGASTIQNFTGMHSGVFRTGGKIRSNEVGDIEAVSGGYLEPISYNPYTGGTGVTSMIKGQSHNEHNGRHSGVIMDYAGNRVEAERGEPISERQSGGSIGDTNAVVAGDQTFGKFGKMLFPDVDEKYVGKKVKNIQKDLAEQDAKLNKMQSKNTKMINDLDPVTPFDKLKLNSLALNEKGIRDRYATNAKKTNDLLEYQEAVNEFANERGLDAGKLTRGKVAPDKLNKKAQNGSVTESIPNEQEYGKNYKIQPLQKGNLPYTKPEEAGEIFQDYQGKWIPKVNKAFNDYELTTKLIEDLENYKGEGADAVKAILSKEKTRAGKIARAHELAIDGKVGPYHKVINELIDKYTIKPKESTPTPVNPEGSEYEVTPLKKTGLETVLGQILPWITPQPGEPLQGDQLAGEMYAMQNNQVEPVQARFYHPQLDVPYDISLQDKLNENQASFNSIKQALGNNPEALASLAGNKYMADSGILGEQFRMNQAKKDQVYSGNRAVLNDAMLKNLAIADTQYGRQAQAKSNTKAIMQEAISSISSKIGQNRLENRTLQTYANMFPDFSFGKDYKVRHTGAPASFNMPVVYNASGEPTHKAVYDKDGNIVDYQPVNQESSYTSDVPNLEPIISKTTKTKTKEGNKTIEEIKKERNGGLVKFFKNI